MNMITSLFEKINETKKTGYDCFQIWHVDYATWRQTTWLYLRLFIPQAIPGTLLININVKQHSNRSGRISQQDIDTEIKGKQKYKHSRKYS